MRDTFRSRQRKIMCFSELQTGRLIWLPECDVSLPFPELRRWLCSAQGEDIWRTEEGEGQRGWGGDSAGREGPLSTDASQGWLPEGCSPSRPSRHPGEQAGSRIRRRVSRWAGAQQRCPCLRRLCKVTSDCFPFQRQAPWKKLFP